MLAEFFSVPENRHFPHIDMMLRICTDGVGWGNNFELHLHRDTDTDRHTRTHTHVMLRYWAFPWTCAVKWGNNVELHLHRHTHTHHATLLDVRLHLHTHTSCYATGGSLTLTRAHTRHATLLDVLLRLHAHTHTLCYATGRSLALAHTHSIYTSTSFIMFTPFNGGGKTRWLMMTCWKSLCGTEGLLNHTDPVGSHCHKKFHEMAAKHFRFPQEQKWWDKSCRP